MKKMGNYVLAALLVLQSLPTLACAFHHSLDEGSPYPGSMYVFWRNLIAQQTNVIEKIDEVEGELGFRRASLWLRVMAYQLEQMGIEDSYILLVDVPMWSHYDKFAFTRLNIDLNSAPEVDETILMTTQAGLNALTSGHIDYSEALRAGILVVKNDPDNEVEELLEAEAQQEI